MVERFNKEDLQNALETLKQGGIILYPTDTVWGIGCDATNASAVEKIYRLKQRDSDKGMLILVDQPGSIPQYISVMPEIAWDLIEMAERPLTIIYAGARNLAANVTGTDDSIGIRVTRELFSASLCSRLRKPIVSTSANISGKPTPRHFGEIDKAIIKGVDYVVKYRQSDTKACQSSGIISLGTHGEIKIIRE